ncbi:type IV pilus modification PilV family protein [Sutcliffiella halmapala]|uniref:type IV pilus modification PilV family protein n=1 Tax=Sutcliffiella halmapala TaxID=79882 RepID=UPI000994A0F6|nr:type II secretion system protein [Sutcliffiella halmapala]
MLRKMKLISNEKGVTLIELLASIVILSIVILGLLTFFSQLMSHSLKVEDKLTTINLAEKVLNEYKLVQEEFTEHELNGKIYYSKVIELPDQRYLDLLPIRVEIYTDNSYNSTSMATQIYGYMEGE